jgi:hypothetical protein
MIDFTPRSSFCFLLFCFDCVHVIFLHSQTLQSMFFFVCCYTKLLCFIYFNGNLLHDGSTRKL